MLAVSDSSRIQNKQFWKSAFGDHHEGLPINKLETLNRRVIYSKTKDSEVEGS